MLDVNKFRLKVGFLSTLYHTSFILKGTDLLDKEGIIAEWKLFPSGPDIVNAMIAGTIDLGYIGLPPVIIGADRGADLKCIAGGHIEGTVMIAGPGYKKFQESENIREFLGQFRGQAIGCPPKGSIHDVIITDMIRCSGVRDIKIVNYPWADYLPEALLSGEIAAALGTPALAVTARRYGNAGIIMPPSQIWPYNPSYGIVVPGAVLGSGRQLSGFLRAHENACELIRRNPGFCAMTVSRVMGIVDPGFVKETFAVSPKYCAALPDEYIASTMKFVEAMCNSGYITKDMDETRIFDKTLISRVHKGPPHYNEPVSNEPVSFIDEHPGVR